jgi:hypothetical protein
MYDQGWPEPYLYTVYDRIFGIFPAENTVYTPYIYYIYGFWPTLCMTYDQGWP